MSNLIVLHGPPAVGKYTIGKEIISIDSKLRLFHNHLVVDMLLSLFPFGSSNFIYHREKIWIELLVDAIKAGENVIFTFNPESSVTTDFPLRLQESIESVGGKIIFIEITCHETKLQDRMENSTRSQFKKLNSFDFYQTLKSQGAFDYPLLKVDYSIDSTKNTPSESASLIYDFIRPKIYS